MLQAIPGSKEFSDLVDNEAKNKAEPHLATWLRSPEIVPLWREQLVMNKRYIDSVMTHHRAERLQKKIDITDPDEYAKYLAVAETWRAKVLWVKKTLEDRIVEANYLMTYSQAEFVSKDEVVFVSAKPKSEHVES